MKKVGIITHYYNSNNYGGLLQAYALYYVLSKMGVQAEQISYKQIEFPILNSKEMKNERINFKWLINKIKIVSNNIAKNVMKSLKKYENMRKYSTLEQLMEKRKKKNMEFRELIPHSRVFTDDSINEISEFYDYYITGSDQVWNPYMFSYAYFLKFVTKKKKIAYAASIAVGNLTNKQKDVIIPLISSFDYISVREESAKHIIEKEISNSIDVVVDPTLLLAKDDWEKIEKKVNIGENYLFTYLLGESKKNRKIIRKIAKEKGLKIVSVPHLYFQYEPSDEDFADIELYDIGPAEFISLIHNASLIITDSFHGCVFSIIFEKEFYSLNRNDNFDLSSMNSRIIDLFKMLDMEDRTILNINQSIETFEKLNYNIIKKQLKIKTVDSMDYLKKTLES
ncbi:MAG: polysaccharide pyruvyl transferase family protein [Bacilli bacterium]